MHCIFRRTKPSIAAGIPVGAALREFCLEYARALGLQQVCAVTKTTDYKPGDNEESYSNYVNSNYVKVETAEKLVLDDAASANGPLKYGLVHKDRGLNFHISRGARKLRTIPGWRPEDVDNEGHGILIQYDLETLPSKQEVDSISLLVSPSAVSLSSTESLKNWSKEDIKIELKSLIVKLLGTSAKGPLDSRQPLMSQGMDSLHVTALVSDISRVFNCRVSSTALFNYPTLEALANHVFELLNPDAVKGMKVSSSSVKSGFGDDGNRPTAVIGMSCRFPGGIEGPSMFWDYISAGMSAAGAVPLSRWDTQYLSNCDNSLRQDQKKRLGYGCFIDDMDMFDPGFFKISPSEAKVMDPQQRLLLEYAFLAIHDAGYTLEELEGAKVCIFL
jgi:acyl carrier protein